MIRGRLLIMCLVAGCGGDVFVHNSPTCTDAPACGGIVSFGRYKLTSACERIAGSATVPGLCPRGGVQIDLSAMSYQGELSFDENGRYTDDKTLNGTLTMVLPADCLMAGGVTFTCTQASELLSPKGLNAPGLPSDVRCSGSSSCNCTFTYADSRLTVSGTYRGDGTNLIFTPDGGIPDTFPYCASGAQLTLAHPDRSDLGMAAMARGWMAYTRE